ncbi:hypothetical protein AHAS_Ahas07G0091800 [Arachis hypogaea]
MEVFGGEMGLVSMVVEDNVEEEVNRHMVVEVNNHNEAHHIHWISMYHGEDCFHNGSEEVVAMKIVHKDEAPPTIDFPSQNANHQ